MSTDVSDTASNLNTNATIAVIDATVSRCTPLPSAPFDLFACPDPCFHTDHHGVYNRHDYHTVPVCYPVGLEDGLQAVNRMTTIRGDTSLTRNIRTETLIATLIVYAIHRGIFTG